MSKKRESSGAARKLAAGVIQSLGAAVSGYACYRHMGTPPLYTEYGVNQGILLDRLSREANIAISSSMTTVGTMLSVLYFHAAGKTAFGKIAPKKEAFLAGRPSQNLTPPRETPRLNYDVRTGELNHRATTEEKAELEGFSQQLRTGIRAVELTLEDGPASRTELILSTYDDN